MVFFNTTNQSGKLFAVTCMLVGDVGALNSVAAA
jgi:hypothetical protein